MRLYNDGLVQAVNRDGNLLADYCGQLRDVVLAVLADAPLNAAWWMEYSKRGPSVTGGVISLQLFPTDRRRFWDKANQKWAQKAARSWRELKRGVA